MNKEKLKELRVKLVKNYKKDYPEGGFILPSWVAELVNIIDAILED